MSYCKSMERKSLACACLLDGIAVALQPAAAEAGFLTGFSGWTMMSDNSTATELVNFTVYQNDGTSGGNWTPQLGVSPTDGTGGGVDTQAQYVYMYEVVNVGGATSKIGFFNINSYDQPYSSAGWLSGKVFNDGAAVGPSGNQYIGTEPGSTPPDDQLNGVPSTSGLSLSGTPFANSATAVNPAGADAGGLGNSDFAAFGFLSGITHTFLSGKFSSVLFLTSNTAPTYSGGNVLDTQTTGSTNGAIRPQ